MWLESPEDSILPEDVNHNYSFTMEMEYPFVMENNLILKIEGNDDIWVFVDNKLQLDLGGIHSSAKGEILFDTIPNLDIGNVYTLKIFYAERHSTGASLKIEILSENVPVTFKSSEVLNFNYLNLVPINSNLSFNTPFKKGIVEIYNASGKHLLTKKFSQKQIGEKVIINTSLSSGIYLVKIINDSDNYYCGKFYLL